MSGHGENTSLMHESAMTALSPAPHSPLAGE